MNKMFISKFSYEFFIHIFIHKVERPQDILKKARERHGYTQTELADKLGIGLRMYQKIEDGQFPKYKRNQVVELDKLLGTNLYELVYEPESSQLAEKVPFYKERQVSKINGGPFMVPLVPVKAQAGYSKAYSSVDFLHALEVYPIVPGIDHRGAIWRYFQVDGDSMANTFNDGDFVLASQVPREDWDDLKDWLVYVIVTSDKVLIKRVTRYKDRSLWVLTSDNERYKQFTIPVAEVRELWKYRRHISWNAAPPKKFEIKL